jgi:hypothetical protein
MSKKEIFFGIEHIAVPENSYNWLGGTLSGPENPFYTQKKSQSSNS